MARRSSPHLARLLPFLGVLLACANTQAATLEALPNASMPGSEIIARGIGYPPSELIEFQLVDIAGGPAIPSGELFADDVGRLFGRLALPQANPGSYRLQAWARGILEGAAPIELLAPPTLTVSPTQGPPGRLVNATFSSIGAGRVTVFYDDVPVLGPVFQGGGSFQASFVVPADRPVPLGGTVEVRAEQSAGGSIAATASTSFQSEPAVADEVVLTTFSGPGEPLSPGETFSFSGQVQLPSFRSPADYRWTAAMRTTNGRLVPVNLGPIVFDGAGNFEGEGVMPTLAAGFGYLAFGQATDLGIVYKIPSSGNSAFLQAVVIDYEPLEVQTLNFNVRRQSDGSPVETAVVNVFANTVFVPPGWNFEEDGWPGTRAAGSTLQKPMWSAAYAPPNQYVDAIEQATHAIGSHTNPVTGCPITLSSGLTNSNGDWQANAVPWLNWFYDSLAYDTSQLDINTRINGPGKATFSANISATHLDLGLINPDNGVCTGQRFDFQYDYDTELWKLRTDLDGDFDLPFDPDETIEVVLPDCGAAAPGIPADPYMPGLPVQHVTFANQPTLRFGAIWSFPDVNGATLIVEDVPQIRLPHASFLFGLLQNPTLHFDGQEVGPLSVEGAACGQSGVDYVIDLPQLVTYPPGIRTGFITAEDSNGDPLPPRFFQIDIRPGPTWINQAADFTTRTIFWSPEKVSLFAAEPDRQRALQVPNPGYGIGGMANDNESEADLFQTLLPSGAGTRRRLGDATSMAVNRPNDPVDNEANGSGSSAGNPVPFGSEEPITVLDTGKIPLFRYAWGIPPIASATVGADIWFKALYAYYGEWIATNTQVLVDVTTEAIAQAGLDVWIDVSVILDLVSLNAFALPNFALTMPLVVEDNQFDAAASEPCFEFALDVAYEVKVGWCPFCIKAGDVAELFDVQEPSACANRTARVARAAPDVPPIDRTSLAVDGSGLASLLWGDGSGNLQFQSYQNGVPSALQSLVAGPGAMGAAHAYYDAGKAVLVYAQSSLTEAQFLALDGDPNDPLDGDYASAVAAQHLVYRVDDGSGWSAPMTLTPPTTGDGGVVLAACPATDSACPAGGEVLAVWVHDASGNIDLHDLRLKYAFFDGLNWGPIGDMEMGSTAKDLQPSATYLNGDPVVVWVRNPAVSNDGTTATLNLGQRRLAYRFLRQSAGVQVPPTLPLGVASPSVAAFAADTLSIAFSVATEGDAFLGTRRSLHTAFGVQCFAGVCQFNSAQERTDSQGRRIFVERPKLSRNLNGQGVITFRQLGVENPTENDPDGVFQHTGALMQLIFDYQPMAPPTPSDPIELSNLGAVNWKVDAVFDPASNAMLTSAVQIETAGGARSTKRDVVPGVKERRIGTAGATLLVAERPMLPEFELIDAQLSPTWIPEGGSAQLEVQLRNNGPGWSEPGPVTVATFWNGPAGLGLPGPVQTIDDLTTGQPLTISLTVPLPASLNEDDEQTLHVVVNPQQQLSESDGSNNARSVAVGALPPPTGLENVDGDLSGTVVIHWTPVDDPRVTGYRVYREDPDGSFHHVGFTDVPGFADFSAESEQRHRYRVSSVAANLNESAPSEPVEAWTLDPDVVFRDGFE
ncbi:fibronectin type III domain-containing protein [Halomonas denitrificans]|nr:fibronectin type III domain-containing protein [Halomonas denitrificans]